MAHSKMVYNAFGEKYQVPRKRVSSLDELRIGDHIAFHRVGLYWHHAIVVDIDKAKGEFSVIHYGSSLADERDQQYLKDALLAKASRFTHQCFNCCQSRSDEKKEFIPVLGKAFVRRDDQLKLGGKDVYVLKHKECLDPRKVVEKAQGKCGAGGYRLFSNNCEHFAMWCKTGKSSSDQVNKGSRMILKEIVKEIIQVPLSKVLETATNVTEMVIKCVTDLLKVVYDVFTATSHHAETLRLRLLDWLQKACPDLQLGDLLQGVLRRLYDVLSKAASKMEFVRNMARWVIEEVIAKIVSGVKQMFAISAQQAEVLKQAAMEYFERVLNPVLREWLDKVLLRSSELCKRLKDVLIWICTCVTELKRKVMERGACKATEKLIAQTVSKVKQHIMKTVAREASEEVLTQTAEEAVRTGIRESSEEVVTQAASKPTAGMVNSLVAGAVCATVIEGGLVAYHIYCQRADMKEGKITEEEFKTAVKKRVTTGAGNVAGSTIGAAIGQVVIPVPVFGGVVGGVIGGLSGSILSSIAANKVFE